LEENSTLSTDFFSNVSAQFLGHFSKTWHQFGVISQSAATINGADLNATSPHTSGAGLKRRFFLQMHHAVRSENAVPSPKKGPASALAARHAAAAAEDGFYFIYTMVWITNRCEESDGLRKTKATRHQQLKTHMQSSPSQKYPSGRANISLSCAPHHRVFIYLRAAGRSEPASGSQRAARSQK